MPRQDQFDIEAWVRKAPTGATSKGLLFTGVIDRVRRVDRSFDVSKVPGLRARYLPFLDYPYVELLRLIPAAARLVHPASTTEEAIHRLARPTFFEVRATMAGKVMVDAFARELDTVLMAAPRFYSLFLNVGRYTTERVGGRHIRMRFSDYPGYLETYDVGVMEGVLETYAALGQVRATRSGPLSGHLDIEWS